MTLTRPARHDVFALDPVGGRPHRVVLDVHREVPRAPREEAPPLVVIDPGHGGVDPGALGPDGLTEKAVVLRTALALARWFESTDSPVRVRLTRTEDVFIPLGRRYRLAEEWGADLFVSLHANAYADHRVTGSEVYFLALGAPSDPEGARLAALENAADRIGGVAPESLTELQDILTDLRRTDTLARSSLAAEHLLGSLDGASLLRTRSVKQAAFIVLRSAEVPSVLVEMGFLTNPEEARLLADDRFVTQMAAALGEGIVDYLGRTDRRSASNE